jgi:hypothetical protein
MNAIQELSEAAHGPVLVTPNPAVEPDPAKVIGIYTFAHPELDAAVRFSAPCASSSDGYRRRRSAPRHASPRSRTSAG